MKNDKQLSPWARLVSRLEEPDGEDTTGADVDHPARAPEPMSAAEEQQLRAAWSGMTPAQQQRAYLIAVILSDKEDSWIKQQVHAAMLQGDYAAVKIFVGGLLQQAA